MESGHHCITTPCLCGGYRSLTVSKPSTVSDDIGSVPFLPSQPFQSWIWIRAWKIDLIFLLLDGDSKKRSIISFDGADDNFFYSSQNMLWWKSFRNVKSYWSTSWDWISLNFEPMPEFKAKIIFPNLPFVDKYFFLHFFGPSELGKSSVRAFSESSVPASALGLFIAICQSNFGPRALA